MSRQSKTTRENSSYLSCCRDINEQKLFAHLKDNLAHHGFNKQWNRSPITHCLLFHANFLNHLRCPD